MRKRHEQGALTVFFSIFILILLLLTGVIVDGARIRSGTALAGEAAQISLYSALAQYHTPLKENYGLFALKGDQEAISAQLQEVLTANLLPPQGQEVEGPFWDLYAFSFEAPQVTLLASLEQHQVLKNQILAYMKYRAPKNLAVEILDLLKELETVSEQSGHLQTKMELERKLSQLAQSEKKLEEAINWFDSFSIAWCQQQAGAMVGKGEKIFDLREDKKSVQDSLQEYRSEGEIDSSVIQNLTMQLIEIEREIVQYQSELSEIQNELTEKLNEALIQAKIIEEEAEAILTRQQVLQAELEDFQRSLEKSKAATEGMKQEAADYKNLTNIQGLQELQQISQQNQTYLQEAISQLASLAGRLAWMDFSDYREEAQLRQEIAAFGQALAGLDLSWSYEKQVLPASSQPEAGLEDNREESAEKMNELLTSGSGKEDVVIPDNLLSGLPSKNTQPLESPKTVAFEAEEEKGYGEDAFETGQSLVFSNLLLDLRDTLYLNEYILEMFHNQVFPLEKTRTAFFNYEVEYVLFGTASQERNFLLTKGEMGMIRFVLNMLYVSQTPRYTQSAEAIATVLSIPFGGAAVPLFKTLILGGWAAQFTHEDLKQLLDGKEVSFYRERDSLKLDYRDYLRLLLLNPLRSETVKLNRIQDLLYLNLSKQAGESATITLSSYPTLLKLELNYSMKTLFFRQGDQQVNFTGIRQNRYSLRLSRGMGY